MTAQFKAMGKWIWSFLLKRLVLRFKLNAASMALAAVSHLVWRRFPPGRATRFGYMASIPNLTGPRFRAMMDTMLRSFVRGLVKNCR